MDQRTILVGLGGIAVGVLLFFGLSRHNGPGISRTVENPDMLAAINRIADAQSEQSQRMDRLEQLYARSTGSAGLPAMRPMGAPAATGAGAMNGPALSPAQIEAKTAAQMQGLDDRLVSDPVSPSWAAANEKTIGDFLSTANLAQQHLPVPSNTRAVCHSHLCRISMTFPDENQASATEAMMLMQIAPSLSNALTFQVPHPDGSVEMVVFAGDAQHIR